MFRGRRHSSTLRRNACQQARIWGLGPLELAPRVKCLPLLRSAWLRGGQIPRSSKSEWNSQCEFNNALSFTGCSTDTKAGFIDVCAADANAYTSCAYEKDGEVSCAYCGIIRGMAEDRGR